MWGGGELYESKKLFQAVQVGVREVVTRAMEGTVGTGYPTGRVPGEPDPGEWAGARREVGPYGPQEVGIHGHSQVLAVPGQI